MKIWNDMDAGLIKDTGGGVRRGGEARAGTGGGREAMSDKVIT